MSTKVETPVLSRPVIFLLTVAVGMIAANLYYAQPLVAQISHALGLKPEAAGLVVTLTQIGYGIGVLLAVPLVDIVENRKLVLSMLAIAILGLMGLAFVSEMVPYFIAAFATGLGASTVQILVPYAAHFAPDEKRGAVVGSMMSGLMIGIMLSRPIASFLTDLFSWHAVFILSAVMVTGLAGLLAYLMPKRVPDGKGLHYGALLKSMLYLLTHTEVLRRRGIYQAFLFGAFCLFWTAVPLLLAGPEFQLTQTGIALFALAGVAGAVSAPFAGRAADRGFAQRASLIAMVSSSVSFLISHFFTNGSVTTPGSWIALTALLFSAVLLDAGISANLVLGQRAIFLLPAEFRGRLNGLYIAMIFVGGAAGSSLGAWAFARGGWELTSWVGFAMPALALAYFMTERKSAA